MTATEHVILVDQDDNPLGTAEKMHAHRENLCHRAFSVFILRRTPALEILLQQRASNKYHSSLLWTNTCCSHPRPGEEIIKAGQRRLKEEMGIEASLESLGSFHYHARFENGLAENEVDHVLVGFCDAESFTPNEQEVHAYRWVPLTDLRKELEYYPEKFTPWFNRALQVVERNFPI